MSHSASKFPQAYYSRRFQFVIGLFNFEHYCNTASFELLKHLLILYKVTEVRSKDTVLKETEFLEN